MDQPRPILLQALPLLPSLEQQLAATYEVRKLPAPGAARDDFLGTHGASIAALATSAAYGFDAPLLAALPNLRV
ncbi:MAG TPA: 2-hydroxyacid dehydrogenase, partial [Ramlibacter sp.]